MEQETKYNRLGKIKARIFALVLLMLSCSLAITAFKSLNRRFDGIIIHKEVRSGFIQKNYDLYLNENYKSTEKIEISNNDAIKILTENFDDYSKVGVSYFAFQDAEPMMSISKKQGSPLITLNGITYIDQGLFWIFISLFGVAISYAIYKQTNVKFKDSRPEESEDIEI